MSQSPPSPMVQPRPAFGTVAVVALALLALPGCSEMKRSLGYEKAPPDEFQVVSRAPLSMPPDFQLRPPAPGTDRPQEGSAREQARASLLGMKGFEPLATSNRDSGDMALLQRAGADQIQPGIRELVDKETLALAASGRTFTDKLVFWRKPDGPGAGEQLDAAKEAERLHQNQALGRAVTEGESPRIERRRRGMLEGIF